MLIQLLCMSRQHCLIGHAWLRCLTGNGFLHTLKMDCLDFILAPTANASLAKAAKRESIPLVSLS